MLKRFAVHHIPHGIDTSVFRPYDQGNIRSLFGIGLDKRVIMFAAAKLSQINKGPDVLVQSLGALPGALKRNTVLLLLGDNSNGLREQLDIEVIHLGYASGDLLKALAYSAADLFVYPTRAETFGLVIQESMACGTPVVSFDVGGVSDLVRHNVTGYLAQAGDLAAFTGGIIQLLEDDKRRQDLGAKSREVIVNEFSIEGQVQRYMQLYSQLCRN
jgi:glycosyltransferase involved in cell wall biosynthesis